jgi:hypothetical protein
LHKSADSELGYNLSAFITAWRSVFDVLLYDYAEQYFKYSEARRFKITKNNFREIAIVLENHENNVPKNFIDWYQKKETELSQLQFWHLRTFFVHRGGKKVKKGSTVKTIYTKKPVEVYTPPSAVSRDAISPMSVYVLSDRIEVKTEKEITIAGMPETVIHDESERVYAIMEKIVKEARKNF